MQLISEGQAKFYVGEGKVTKKLTIFYNPMMKHNRDISIALLSTLKKNDMQVALPLAGSGVRGIRFLKEVPKEKIKQVFFNDRKADFKKIMKKNLSLNSIKDRYTIANTDANLFLLEEKGFDYIDIDPFGTPSGFLDAALRRLGRDGIIAVTATDTGCLAGVYPKACMRKYWAKSFKSPIMHETGLRILIRKIQLIGAQYDKALTPIYSFFKNHYVRVFLHCEKGKERVDKLLKLHDYLEPGIGPLWKGQLFDRKTARAVAKQLEKEGDKELVKFVNIVKDEAAINTIGFYHIHALARKYHIPLCKTEDLMGLIKKQGFKVSLTHFTPLGIRSTIPLQKLLVLMKKASKP